MSQMNLTSVRVKTHSSKSGSVPGAESQNCNNYSLTKIVQFMKFANWTVNKFSQTKVFTFVQENQFLVILKKFLSFLVLENVYGTITDAHIQGGP